MKMENENENQQGIWWNLQKTMWFYSFYY